MKNVKKNKKKEILKVAEFKVAKWNLEVFRHVLAQFPFTPNHTELNYYHQKVNVWVVGRFKTEDPGKLGNFKKFYEIIGTDDECTVHYLKTHIDNVPENFPKVSSKTFHRKI